MQTFHLAQLNIGKVRYKVEDPRMSGFMDNLDKINALAEASPGFIWRLKDENNNATSFHVFDDPNLLINMSVWESIESLKNYVYKSDHVTYLRQRKDWFHLIKESYMVLWWVPEGHVPTAAEAKQKLEYLQENGASLEAFTFKEVFLIDK